MTIQQTIPLNLLVPSPANVRRTGRAEGIAELAASIAAHGLRQNLNVRQSPEGERFEVVAGGRRLRAMKLLAKQGAISCDAPVRCLLIEDNESAEEISLAENTLRTAMHPDDQCAAFRTLIEDKGLPVADVAARFGVTPAVVRQRLKLATVAPKLRALFRKGAMSLDHVMAFTLTDDHATQETVWESLPDWNREPEAIRRALTEGAVRVSDRLAVFVGLEAYQAAGGTILRDLFDDAEEGYLADRALVMRLVEGKLANEAETVRAEGWKWVKIELTRDYQTAYQRLPGGRVSAKNKARAGAILRIAHDGTLEVDRGLIDPQDAKAEARAAQGADAAAKPAGGYSATLVADLTAHRTAALRDALAGNPQVALACTVHRLACQLLHIPEQSCLVLRAESAALDRHVTVVEDCPAHQNMKDRGERWRNALPGEDTSLLAWCLGQTQAVLLDLLAYLAALTVDAVQQRQGRADAADQLAKAVALDMAAWWKPSVEGFFARLSKAQLIEAMGEAGVTAPAPFESVKKPDATKMAAKALDGSGWLPQPLRMA